jgi:hypothetical protein
MMYEIAVPAGIKTPPDFELVHDNPKSANENLQELQSLFPQTKFYILRDGTPLRLDQLDADIESYEIAEVREDSCQLPATYRRGWSTTTDEVAKGPDGKPTKVWDPGNPEDRFDVPRQKKPQD